MQPIQHIFQQFRSNGIRVRRVGKRTEFSQIRHIIRLPWLHFDVSVVPDIPDWWIQEEFSESWIEFNDLVNQHSDGLE